MDCDGMSWDYGLYILNKGCKNKWDLEPGSKPS
jgi:hypothetical protein